MRRYSSAEYKKISERAITLMSEWEENGTLIPVDRDSNRPPIYSDALAVAKYEYELELDIGLAKRPRRIYVHTPRSYTKWIINPRLKIKYRSSTFRIKVRNTRIHIKVKDYSRTYFIKIKTSKIKIKYTPSQVFFYSFKCSYCNNPKFTYKRWITEHRRRYCSKDCSIKAFHRLEHYRDILRQQRSIYKLTNFVEVYNTPQRYMA